MKRRTKGDEEFVDESLPYMQGIATGVYSFTAHSESDKVKKIKDIVIEGFVRKKKDNKINV